MVTPAELLARYSDPAVQAELDAKETVDAVALLKQLGSNQDSPEALRIVKGWLKTHWSAGWRAAGGPSGGPEPASGLVQIEAPRKKRKKAGAA